jgi:hypothetical protein
LAEALHRQISLPSFLMKNMDQQASNFIGAHFNREQFIVYGYDKNEQVDNLTFKPPSQHGFLQDLANCKAVMATAGFTLMTEAIHLQKPYLALPMRGQYEQELNGHLLDKLGYGANVRRINHNAVGNFLYHIPDYAAALKSYTPTDNNLIKDKLDELLADNCSLLKKFHYQRS